jgi:sec-independent protein translocase protein TatB
MFDIAWSEMLVLIVIAIVVIGPKDLPKVMRSVGGWIRKARALASEFRFSMDELARDAELDEIRKNAAIAADFDPNEAMKKALDPGGEIAGDIEELTALPKFDAELNDLAGPPDNLEDDAAKDGEAKSKSKSKPKLKPKPKPKPKSKPRPKPKSRFKGKKS